MKTGKFSSAAGNIENGSVPTVACNKEEKTDDGHENMKNMLASSAETLPRRSRGNRSLGRSRSPDLPEPKADVSGSPVDVSDEIMDRLVKSVTQNPNPRPSAAKERKRSRANRKSLRRTLKSGLSDDMAQALGLAKTAEVQV